MWIELQGVIVPSTHVVARSRLSGSFPEWLEQHVFIEGKKEGVIGVELLAHRAVRQRDLAISKLFERRGDRNLGAASAAGGRASSPRERGDCRSGPGFQECAARVLNHNGSPGIGAMTTNRLA